MEEATSIVWDYLAGCNELTPAFENFLQWMGDDEVISWFVNGYFVRDDNDMKNALGKEDAKKVLDYYDRHCRRD